VLQKVAPAAQSILIVDNEPSAVRLIERMLPGGGNALRVFRAYSGKEAIARAAAQVPDVILLDLMMEDGTGFDVIAHLRSQPRTASIPIIAVSGCAVEELWQGNVIEIKSARGFTPTQLLNYLGAALDVTPPAKVSHHTILRSSSADHPEAPA
jgi:CheY-like chemotaxis protein